MDASTVKAIRSQLGMSQQAFAQALGVSFATVNRWENNKARPQKDRVERIKALLNQASTEETSIQGDSLETIRLDFEGDPDAIKLVVDAQRLQNGHVFNKAFGLETSRVVPLPHQRIAVYEHLLSSNPLRFLLADDAGAGKTIMTGLYIREMINRGRLKRVLICAPAGLTWNWQRELLHFFDLEFTVLRGIDFQKGDPLSEPDRNLFIISVDTAATDLIKDRLISEAGDGFDLVVFDEAHKLAWMDLNRTDSKTRRYRLAEALSRRTTHLLLLTATPHMGKPDPYFALWRLLDPKIFSTKDAWRSFPQDKRGCFFIRRLKEEMVGYNGQPIYKPRLCQTITFKLTPAEQEFYDESTNYLRWSYDTNRSVNRSAAAMVVAVLQRRLASSTYAMLQSLERRKQRITAVVPMTSHAQLSLERVASYLDTSTADENEPDAQGRETDEDVEDFALSLARPSNAAQVRKELEYLDRIMVLGERVRELQQETKFLKLRELVESTEFRNQQLLIFTEHRDTLEYLRQRFDALGYSGQVASIHGGMDVEERERQRIFFMPPDVRREQGVRNPDAPTARIMLATDAAGEGINLQFAWLMVNFDIPWNPARLEQRMGRLHRFGQRHSEVRIFNLVAEGTREGDVLSALLNKLDEARQELCSDKVFDVIGQQLNNVSLRDLLRDALYDPQSAHRKLDSIFATQRLRAAVEEQRKTASTYGDVAKRLGQLNSEVEVEQFNHLLPAYIQNFIDKAAPRLGMRLDGDVANAARLYVNGQGGDWLRKLRSRLSDGFPEFLTVRREPDLAGVDPSRTAFLRPGEIIFDAICEETIRRFQPDVNRGGVFCDPAAERPYCVALYLCQLGEPSAFLRSSGINGQLFERHLIGIRWDDSGNFEFCAPNHLLALQGAPRSLTWRAGSLLVNPEEHAERANVYARMVAETKYLQQLRTALRAEVESRLDDLSRGFDFQGGELAEKRSELARRARDGDAAAAEALEEIKKQQAIFETEKVQSLLYEQRKPELLDIIKLERIALSIVVPDPTPEARDTYNKNIEAVAMRIARNFEIDRYNARVFDVSSPSLARGYDLESHRANGEKVVIEVKGRSGRGPVHLTDNEWPTAANIRDKYWLYVVVDCATDPKLFRVSDPIRLAFNTRQTFTLNIGEIMREAEHD
ncbi:MAG TPA: helicase-related protein [Pyrinomonadaceae bacterium]|jgi:SNF2 family DNA or RNA helicase